MTPVTVGLLLAIPLAALTARTDIGVRLRKFGLLIVPEEREPPRVLQRANELTDMLARGDAPLGEVLRHKRVLGRAHLDTLEPPAPRERGQIDADLVLAKAKLAEFHTAEEAHAVLSPREKRALFSDPQGFSQLLAMARH
jgi:membrane glycosyltransferase